MAKKPLEGHTCASCEHYIGELNNSSSSKYIPYSKLQTKESEKLYRAGEGYSKLLNLVSFDNSGIMKDPFDRLNNSMTRFDKQESTTINPNQTAIEFGNKSLMGKGNSKKDLSLPKVKRKKRIQPIPNNLDLSIEGGGFNNSSIIDNEEFEQAFNKDKYDKNPKIVKIYKKNKNDL